MKFVIVTYLLVFNIGVYSSVVIDATAFNSTKDYSKDINELLGIVGERYTTFDLKMFVNVSGFPMDEYKIITEDGYKLILHRISHGRYDTSSKRRPAVLLMNGILGSSAELVTLGPERSLAMQLADLDYDVWLGNNRGNTYSRNHNTLDPDDDEKFWNFSFHELGTSDLSATIDFILKETGNLNLTYVGISQGTTQVFVLLAQKPDYNKKVNLVIALAPVTYMEHISGPIPRLAADHMQLVQALLGKNEVLGHSELISFVLSILCNPESGVDICPLVAYAVAGFDSVEMDKRSLLTFLKTFPAGTSSKSLVHYMQLIKSGKFAQYDYGVIGNMKNYKSRSSPEYNLSNIDAPVELFYGENDWLTSPIDVEKLAGKLQHAVLHPINHKFFNHLDFLIAKDVNKLVYFDVINSINLYNNKKTITTTSSAPETKTSTKTPNGNSGRVTSFNFLCILPALLFSLKRLLRISIISICI